MNNADKKFWLDNFKSTECLCGKSKKPRFVFCYKCFWELTKELRNGLYSRVGQGFFGACEEAYKYLKEKDPDYGEV